MTIAGNAVAFVPGSALVRARRIAPRRHRDHRSRRPSLAQAKESNFTVALSPTDAAPVLDPIPAILCGTSLA